MNQPRRILAAAAVVALALTGCAHSASDAAVVDGVVLPDSEIQAASAAAAPIAQQSAAALAASVVQAEVQGLIAQKIAAKHNVPLTDATRADVVSTSDTLKALLATTGGKTLGIRIADMSVVAAKVDTDVFTQECSAVAVTLNPRYGTWAKELCGLESGIGSLSKPAPTAAATNG
jgi:hypothetical protein